MKKIAIVGSAGSGKSTLAQKMGKKLHLPVIHLDTLFHKPGWVETPEDEWIEIQKELIKKPEWIIDGMYRNSLELRLEAADTIVLLHLPKWLNIYRVIKRSWKYYGKSRPDLADGCPETFDIKFFKFVYDFPQDEILKRVKKYEKKKDVYILKSQKEIVKFLQQL